MAPESSIPVAGSKREAVMLLFFVESGTIHAIGAGITVVEIQKNSNVTYRVYDYGRRDKNGNERELHIDKALEVTIQIS